MLTIGDGHSSLGRREFLRIGGMTLGGLTLSNILDYQAAASIPSLLRGKSVVFLFMHGGPSQTETFDPKMTAPANVRSQTGEISTSLSGVTFGSSFPRLASMADRLAIVRSFTTGDGNHDIKPVVGRDSFGANLGTVLARVAGPNNTTTGVPSNVALFPRSVDDSTQPGNFAFGNFRATGPLGGAYAPYVPGGGDMLQNDMDLKLPLGRFDDRRQLLRQIDQVHRRLETTDGGNVLPLRQQAYRMLMGSVADAFDLSREDAKTVDRYDTSRLVQPDQISKRWNNHKNYADNAKALGKLMLLARRLCEFGAKFVTVTTNFVWDMHADDNNATMVEGMSYMGPPFDHAVSTFLDDLHQRGLQDNILLVACGEMGRTPKLNERGGRDHWGGLAPLLLAGGGLKMGQVIGKSNADAGVPASEPITIRNLIATIMHTTLDLEQLRLQPGMPKEVSQEITGWTPIRGLH